MSEISFGKLIRDKRIIFVGPSPYLIGLNRGKWLDSFDIVIRTNGAFPVKNKYIIDYGKRCDILYINLIFSLKMRPLPVKIYKKNELKYLCMKYDRFKDENSYKRYVKVRTIGYSSRSRKLKSKINGVLMGVLLIEDILQYRPKEFYVIGIDFYEDKNNTHFNGYHSNKISINLENDLIKHNKDDNTKHIIELVDKGKIIVDEYINELIKKFKDKKGNYYYLGK